MSHHTVQLAPRETRTTSRSNGTAMCIRHASCHVRRYFQSRSTVVSRIEHPPRSIFHRTTLCNTAGESCWALKRLICAICLSNFDVVPNIGEEGFDRSQGQVPQGDGFLLLPPPVRIPNERRVRKEDEPQVRTSSGLGRRMRPWMKDASPELRCGRA